MGKDTKALIFSKALPLSAILGKCKIKSIGSDLFFPIIKLKADLSAAQLSFENLQKGIMTDAGIEVNADGSIPGTTPIVLINQMQVAIKKLGNDDSGVKNWELFSEANLRELHGENPELTTADLAELFIMVK